MPQKGGEGPLRQRGHESCPNLVSWKSPLSYGWDIEELDSASSPHTAPAKPHRPAEGGRTHTFGGHGAGGGSAPLITCTKYMSVFL